MEAKNLEKAMDIYAKLITGEEISRTGPNGSLYEDYYGNTEVYVIVGLLLKKLNLNLYEYKESLFLSAGDANRVFGYTNEELKRSMGLRYNRELYLCFFLVYEILLAFYTDSGSYQFREFIRIEDVMEEATRALSVYTRDASVYDLDEEKQESFRAVALLWDELPASTGEAQEELRASRASKSGFVKLVFNFLVGEKLFVEMNKRYYPTGRFQAIVEHYFEEYRGQIYEALSKAADGESAGSCG